MLKAYGPRPLHSPDDARVFLKDLVRPFERLRVTRVCDLILRVAPNGRPGAAQRDLPF